MTSMGLGEQQILNVKRSWMFFVSLKFFYLIPRYIFDEVVLTNQKFHVRTGLIWKDSISMPLRKISNVGFEQGLFGRIFGYGTIVIESGTTTSYPYIKDPERVKNAIEQAIEQIESK